MKTQIVLLSFCFLMRVSAAWHPIEQLAQPGVVNHNIAIDLKGNSCAAWVRASEHGFILESSTKSYGSIWGSPEVLSKDVSGLVPTLKIITDTFGNAHVVWVEENKDGNIVLQSATKVVGQKWTSPETISSGLAMMKGGIQLATDSYGRVFAVWEEAYDLENAVIKLSEKNGPGSWSKPINLSEGGFAYLPQIAADASGVIQVIWERVRNLDSCNTIESSEKCDDSSWSKPKEISYEESILLGTNLVEGFSPKMTLSPNGNFYAVWYAGMDAYLLRTRIFFSTKAPNSEWSLPETISSSNHIYDTYCRKLCLFPNISADSEGNVTATWIEFGVHPTGSSLFNPIPDISSYVQAAKYSPSRGWSAPKTVSAGMPTEEGISPPQIEMDRKGNALIVWKQKNEDCCTIMGAILSCADEEWSAPFQISQDDKLEKSNPQMIVDNKRNFHISWLEGSESNSTIKIVVGVCE